LSFLEGVIVRRVLDGLSDETVEMRRVDLGNKYAGIAYGVIRGDVLTIGALLFHGGSCFVGELPQRACVNSQKIWDTH
jgi:hypothetical protein